MSRLRGFAYLKRYSPVVALLSCMLVYAAGLNPYFPPDQHDDVVYFYGGRSLAERGSFSFATIWEHAGTQTYLIDHPPGLSLLLALPAMLGFRSVLTAKAVVWLSACLSMALLYYLLGLERRRHRLLICCATALLPTGLLMGTRVMTEWPFMAVSFLFLISLGWLRTRRRTVAFGILCGLVLAAAALTRWVGVLLGAAAIGQGLTVLRIAKREPVWRRALPEAVACISGTTIWLAWRARCAWHLAAGTALSTGYYEDFLGGFSLWPLLVKYSELLFSTGRVLGYLHLQKLQLADAVTVIAAVVTALGGFWQFRSRSARPSDWYAVTTVLFLLLVTWLDEAPRHLLPIAPFLLSYLFCGLERVWRQLSGRRSRWVGLVPGVALGVWISTLLILDGYLLIAGNAKGTHGGLCIVASPSGEEYYRGGWRDLYLACQQIANDERDGPVSVVGISNRRALVHGTARYIMAFTNRECLGFPPPCTVAFVVSTNAGEDPWGLGQDSSLSRISRHGSVVVYKTSCAPVR